MTIAIREYTDNQGQTKKVWKTIGELITWDDGKQSFEVWGPTGSTRGSVFEQTQQGQQPQQQQPQQMQQQPQQQQPQNGYQQAQQQPQQQQGNNFNNDVPF
jgi:single-stranded DNA-binding protein